MRTDRAGGAGPEVPARERPIWDERAPFDERDTAEIQRIDYPYPNDGPTVAPQSRGLRSGRHQAAPEQSDPAPQKAAGAADSVPRRLRRRGELVRTGIRGLGQTLITGGLVVLLFVVYELFVTDLMTDQRQEELTDELLQGWEDDPTLGPDLPGGGLSQIPLGDGFAFIRIPVLGADYVRVVVEGTTADALRQGPGHYVDSAMPGELGNFSLAGHRTGKGSPFIDLDVLKPGDAVVIETVDTYFTYRVLGDPATGDYDADPSGIPGMEIVAPQDVEVIFPIPGADDASVDPTAAYLTLTTCHPKFSNEQRLIIHAVLEGPGLSKVDYPDGPPALTEV
ncbi:MAG: class E sortase [Actinomycetota bacterium]|nr:class E sortase [Actinomycetota bacterium]